jgi:hypothetical protein
MTCRDTEQRLAGYLDGAISSRDHGRVREHLGACSACRVQLAHYQRLATCLANVEPSAPPADLAVRIRVNVDAAQSRTFAGNARRVWSRALMTFENIFRPLAVPATGGVLTALVVFVLLVQNILVGVPLGGVVANDLPLNLVHPARLESLAPFPMPGVIAKEGHPTSGALLLEATLNAQGQVVSYRIISGPTDSAVSHQLDQLLLFSRFSPRVSFGLPTAGGRVLLSFSEVRVQG